MSAVTGRVWGNHPFLHVRMGCAGLGLQACAIALKMRRWASSRSFSTRYMWFYYAAKIFGHSTKWNSFDLE